MNATQARALLVRLGIEARRRAHEIERILKWIESEHTMPSTDRERLEWLADQADQAAEDAGAAHGHPGAPRKCRLPVPSPYNAATGGILDQNRRD